MSQWMNTLDLTEIWEQLENETIDVAEGGKKIAAEIKSQLYVKSVKDLPADEFPELEEIVDEFSDIEEGDAEQFDEVMHHLYDWADTSLDGRFGGKKLCWVNTQG